MATDTLNPTADTYITETGGTHGTSSTMVAGRLVVLGNALVARMLMRFSLAAYAATNIYAATLRLAVGSAFIPEGPHNFTLHEVTTAWTETDASWSAASSGVNWSTAGGDFEPTAFANGTVSPGDSVVEIDVLQKALEKRGQGFDFMLRMPETAEYLNHYLTADTRENETVGLRPQLILALSAVSVDWRSVVVPPHFLSRTEPASWIGTNQPLNWIDA